MCLFFSLRGKAEGSKDMYPSGASGYRAYLNSTTMASATNPFPTAGTMKVYVKAGESIYVGSSAQGVGNGTINLRAPNGNTYTTGNGGLLSLGAGVINNRTQELLGPLVLGGWVPAIFTVGASEAGIWEVDFVAPSTTSNTSPNTVAANANWTQPTNSNYIAAFDVSVRNSNNTAFITGRVFTNVFTGILGAYDIGFNTTFRVLTKDGFLYTVNNNGQAGNGFSFFANNKGFQNSSGAPSYKSVNTLTSLATKDPRTADTQTDITQKIFFNTPASDLPATAASLLGTDWLLTTPVSPVASAVSFAGIEGTPNTAGTNPAGGNITFTANQAGNFAVDLDLNNNGVYSDSVDRRLTGIAVAGTNTVYWDGLNGKGVKAGATVSTSTPINMRAILFGGEIHFPFLDVERNVNGIIITRTNGSGSGDNTVYWDDTNISTVGTPSNPLKTTIDGLSSTVNGHRWGTAGAGSTEFGDVRGLDTWAYVLSAPATSSATITLREADLQVVNVTSNAASQPCQGTTITYTIPVKNNGPDAVTGAKFAFTFPAEFTNVTVSSSFTSGTSTVSSGTTTSTAYNASLNMNNGAIVTFTVTGTISTIPSGGSLVTKASIMRPADVTDPDATNPDAAAPTDPQSECDALPSGVGCNNIINTSTQIYAFPTTANAGAAQTLCAATSTTLAGNTPAVGTGAWSKVSGPGTPVFANAATPGTSVTGLTTGTYVFRWTISNGNCAVSTSDVQITVLAALAGNTITAPTVTTFCTSGDAAVISGATPTGGTGTYTYQWQSSADGTTFTDISGATAASYDPPAISSTTYYRRGVASGICSTMLYSNAVTITIQPAIAGNSITAPATTTFCASGDAAVITGSTPTGGSGTYAYQWQSSTDNSTFTDISGATASSYDPPSTTVTTYYRRSVTSGACTSASVSNVISITINPALTAGSIGSDQSFCVSGDPAAFTQLSAATGGTGTYTTQWQSSVTSASAGFSNISGATAATYDAPAITQTTWYRRVLSSGNCADAISNVIMVTINPALTAGSVSANQTFCASGDPAVFTQTAPTGGTGAYTYQWQVSTDNSSFSAISGATAATYDAPAVSQTTYYRRVVTSGTCSAVNSNTLTVTVTPAISNNTIAAGQTICSGTAPAALTGSTPANGTGAYTYVWESSADGVSNFTTAAGSSNAQNYTPGNLTQTIYYRRRVSSGTCADAISNVLQITVNGAATGANAGPDQGPANITSATLAANSPTTGTGKWTQVSGPNTASFVNDAQFNTVVNNLVPGTYTFRWTITNLPCAASTDDVLIKVNNAPVAQNDAVTTNEDVAATIAVLANDSDADGTLNTSSVTIVAGPAHGTAVVNGNGTITYTPAANYNGADNFTYTVQDNLGTASAPASVAITVTPVNDAPVAVNDQVNLTGNASFTVNAPGVLANDTDADGDQLVASLVTTVTRGTLTLNGNGSFTYTPATGFSGLDSFIYRACDASNACATATVILNVANGNRTPVATADSYTLAEDGSLTTTGTGVLSNDTDADGDVLSATLVSNVSNGTLVLNSNGTFTYTPAANFNGTDQFSYKACDPTGACSSPVTVTFTVTSVNDKPVAQSDAYTVNEDQVLTVAARGVLLNDTDVDGDVLSASVVTAPAHGTLVLNTDGSFTYTPAANFNGTDQFRYRACDGGSPQLCDTATVSVTVNPVNDAPVAANDNYTTPEDQALSIAAPGVLSNDTDVDGDALTAAIVTNAAKGTVTLQSNGSFLYTPNANYNGLDSFTYSVCDASNACATGKVYLIVSAVNDAPVVSNASYSATEDQVLTIAAPGLVSNGSDVDGDALTAALVTQAQHGTVVVNADGSFTYTPNANYNGSDVFTYQLCDPSGACTQATASVTVSPVNDAPVAVADNYTATEDVTLNVSAANGVLSNDTDVDGDRLTASLLIQAAHGSVTMNADGSFSYTPAADYNGVDSFTYRVCDPSNACATGTVKFNVTAVNDAPVARRDAYTVAEDSVLTIAAPGLLFNDYDVDGDAFTASLSAQPVHGAVTVNANGSFVYTPAANYNGTDSFTYRACDAGGLCSTATVILTVTAVNDAPVAANDSYTTAEDTRLDIAAPGVLTNDSDVDGDAITASVVRMPANGTLTLHANGSFSYTPSLNFNGKDSFDYRTCDGSGACSATGTVVITVTPVNDPPVIAGTVTYSGTEDITLNVAAPGLLFNASDPENDPISASVNTQPLHGTLTVNANGSFTYVPAANYNGTDTFTYKVCDASNACSIGTAIITIAAVNDAPVAGNDVLPATLEDVAVNIPAATLLVNDSDPEGDALTISIGSQPANGTLVQNGDGSFTYTPAPNFNGVDSFTYRVCDNGSPSLCSIGTVRIPVTPVNDKPSAVTDRYTVNEDAVLTVAAPGVLFNDSDPDNAQNTLTASLVRNPLHGTATINANGSFTYTPNADYNGIDTIAYRVCDPDNSCDTGLVIISVTSVNDVPVAVNDSYNNLQEDATYTVTAANGVLANDTDKDGDVLNASVVTGPLHGSLTLNADGSFTYTPVADYNGLDSFIYKACDVSGACAQGTVTFTIANVNDAPVTLPVNYSVNEDQQLVLTQQQLIFNDRDADGDALTVTAVTQPAHGTLVQNGNGTYTYTPAANYNGVDSFTYTVSDGHGGVATGTVQLTVNPVNDAPVAVNDQYQVTEDQPFTATVNVLANDTDVDGDALQANLLAAPLHGSVTFNNDGTFTYTPSSNFNGTDSLTYIVSDGKGGTDTGTVVLVVAPVNDNPVATNDSYTTNEDVPFTAAAPGVLFNDTDPDISTNAPGQQDVLTVTAETKATAKGGTVQINANGSFTYTPAANYNGIDSFSYTVNDGKGGQAQGTVIMTVQAVNDAPVATNDSYTLAEDTPLTTTPANGLLANDTDVDGDALTAALLDNPLHGTVTINADGTFTYSPNANYNGGDSFTYTVSDGKGGKDTGTVTLTVTAVDDPPVANNDNYYIATNGTLSIAAPGVLQNDVDVDSPLSAELVSGPSTGLTFNSDGSFVYVTPTGFVGTVTFSYRLCSTCTPATVTLNVGTSNRPPVANADSYTTAEDNALTVNAPGVLGNDTDPDETGTPTLSARLVTNVSHGTLQLNGDGSFYYVPAQDFNGTDNFTYRAKDANGDSSDATVTITVTAVNDKPVANNDSYTIDEDTQLTGNVGSNDTDVDDVPAALTYTLVQAPAHGTMVLNANGSFTYNPNANYNGADAFTYSVCDAAGACSNAVASISITAVNDAPVAAPDSYSVTEDVQLVVPAATGVLANDTDVDGDPVVAVLVTAAHGTLNLQPDGSFTYTPNASFAGVDSFSYQACDHGTPAQCSAPVIVILNVGNVNDAPVAGNDSYTTAEDTALVVAAPGVLANDTDADGDVLTPSVQTGPSHGSLTLNADGSFVYTPNANYNGFDQFSYTISDGNGGVDTGLVSITVTAENDKPIANPDTYDVTEDSTLTVGAANGVLKNDISVDGGVIVAILTQPSKGSITLRSDGSFIYIPQPNANGVDSFSYQACDVNLCSDPVTVRFSFVTVNDAPVAVTDSVTAVEDVTYNSTVSVMANDTDAEGTFGLAVTPGTTTDGRGTLVMAADGNYTFTPAPDFNGIAEYAYQLCDTGGLCTQGRLIITVIAVNDAPVANPDTYQVTEDSTLRVDASAGVLANDYDADGEAIVSLVSQPSKGTLQLNADGSFIYTPQSNATGIDSFSYRACDLSGACSADVTVKFVIGDVNDAPVAVSDTATVAEDGSVIINVLANDTDADQGQVLTATLAAAPAHGTVVQNPDGTFTYTPDANYNGADFFTYTVCDNGTPQYCSNGTVNITVTPVNDAPVGVADSYVVTEDSVLTVAAPGVMGNDSDPDGESIWSALVTNTVHGSVVLNNDGSFTYTPVADYNGLDSFTYRVLDATGASDTVVVALTVTAANDAPAAVNDGPYNVNEDAVLNVSAANGVLANDTDADGDALTAAIASQPAHGTLVMNADGSFVYTPDADYNGTDNFTYRVCDASQACTVGSVSITIAPQPDKPVAVNDAYNGMEDAPLQITAPGVLLNDKDADGDLLVASVATGPLHGSLTLNPDGSFTYTGNPDYNGIDSFTYSVCDPGGLCATGTVVLSVAAVADAPQAGNINLTATEDTPRPINQSDILSSPVDADGDSLSVVINGQPLHGTLVQNPDGSYTYTPAANYAGADQFTYTVCDNGNPPSCSTGTIYVTVNAVNDAPVGAGDSYTVSEDTTLVVPAPGVIANDTDADGDQMTVTLVTGTVHGSVTLQPDGGFRYTPEANYNGVDSFVYRVCDASGACSNATALINITAVNDAPVAVDDNFTVMEDMPVTFRPDTVLVNDYDVDGDVLTPQRIGTLAHGTLVTNADGTLTYTPDPNFTGVDSIQYKVCDPGGLCDTAYVRVTVLPVNDAPVAVNDTLTTDEDVPLNITAQQLMQNDSDPDGDALTLVIQGAPAHGTISSGGNNAYVYTPNTNYNGVDSFVYRVYDQSGAFADAVVRVVVRSVNDRPTVVSDVYTTAYNTPVSGNVLANDSDADGDPLTASLVTQPLNGTITFNADGAFTYTPTTGFSGTETFTYQACDTASPQLCDSKLISITVQAPGNRAPVAQADSIATIQDTPVSGNVLSNDSDADMDTLTATVVTMPAQGTLVLNGNGNFTYTPADGYTGVDSFTYKACDNRTPALCSDVITVRVKIVPPNSRPVAMPDTYTVNEDDTLRVAAPGVMANDVYAGVNANDTLTVNTVVPPAHGTVTIGDDGSLLYIPAPNFNGKDSIGYQICSAINTCDVALVIITVNAVNDAPVVGADVYGNVQEDVPFITTAANGVLVNDTDADGETLTASLVTPPSNGTVVLNSDGSFTYTPYANYNGVDSFVYKACDASGSCVSGTVKLTVLAANDEPVTTPVSYTVNEDEALTLTEQQITFNDQDSDGDSLYIASVQQPAHGSFVKNTNGTYTYTPAADYSGADSVVYFVTDGSGAQVRGVIYFTVSAVNDMPLAADDSYTVAEDIQLMATTSVLVNDTDKDGDTLTASVLSGPAHGSLAFNSDGTFTYQPGANYNGTDTFTYLVHDGKGGSDTGLVTITVTAVNDSPVANADSYTTMENTPYTSTGNGVLFNDTDPDIVAGSGAADVLSVTAETKATAKGGTVVLNANGSFTYTPAMYFSGIDSFTYQLNDGAGGVATGTVTMNVTGVNNKPVAVNDTYTLAEDETLSNAASVLVNDTDPDGDTLYTILVAPPSHGIITLNADGTFSYTPDANYNGSDIFSYAADDNHGGRDTAVVTFTITPVDDAPVAANDFYYVATDSTLTVAAPGVLFNDVDVDSPLSAELVTTVAPEAGTLTFNADGSFVFVPATGYNGPASFSYRLCASCTPVAVTIAVGTPNQPPVAVADTYTIAEDGALSVDAPGVLGNDTDPNEPGVPALAASLVTGASHGRLTLLANGSFTYTPDVNYNGTDRFTYVARDANGAVSEPVTVVITVSAVNDAPVAVNDVANVDEDNTLNGNVLTNDVDVDDAPAALSVSVINNVLHGTLVLNSNGTYTYTPQANYNGIDEFTYRVCDAGGLCDEAVVTITVNSINDAPVAVADAYTVTEDGQLVVPVASGVLANDTDADNESIVAVLTTTANGTLHLLPDGSFTYTPNANFNGIDQFTYQACDNGTPSLCSAPVTVTLNITAVNDAPVAVADSYTTQEDVALTVAAPGVLANDTDVDGDTLTVAVQTAPAHGTLVLNDNGGLVYTPDSNYNGADQFTYLVKDGKGGESAAQVTINVASVNDTPVANGDTYTVSEDSVLVVTAANGVLKNDTDADGDAIVSKLVTAARGKVTLNLDGSFTYVPLPNAYGIDSFSYQACDANACSGIVTVTFHITPQNDAPVAVNDTVTINEDVVYTSTASVTANDYDPDGTTTLIVTPQHSIDAKGILDLTSDGNFVYTPAANYNGTATYTYQVCDATSLCATAQLVIIVKPVNDAPAANADAYSVRQNDTLRVTAINGVLVNDTDADNDPLKVTLVTPPSSGQLTLNADGSFVYIPANGFAGTISFVYNACDNATPSLCDTGLVTITVVARVNQAPVATDDSYTVTQNGVLNNNVITNDRDPEGTALTASLILQPLHGTLLLNANGTFTYTPANGYSGTDTFSYRVCDNGSPSMCDTAGVSITVRPIPLLGLAKAVTETKQELDGSYTVTYKLTVKNYGNVALSSVQVIDRLTTTFANVTSFTMRNVITATGGLIANDAFDGRNNTLLLKAGSTVAANAADTITFSVNVLLPATTENTYNNSAVANAISAVGTVSDISTNGLDPDPDGNGTPGEENVTPVTLKGIPVKIPQGFSPNNDGINDYFVIGNVGSSRISLEMYNRWGNLIYKNTDYRNNWDGRSNQGPRIGDIVPDGTYYYIVVVDGKDKYVNFITINR
ncbi:thrombospondin type 3 repeat family [Filimonas lacunae]|nr:thrombospondin type 3 repeat family [Filimonas lacunae]